MLTIPVLVLGMDEASDHSVPARGVHCVKPLSAVTVRVVVEDFPCDLVTGVESVRVLRKRILRAHGAVTFVIWIKCVPFPCVFSLYNMDFNNSNIDKALTCSVEMCPSGM